MRNVFYLAANKKWQVGRMWPKGGSLNVLHPVKDVHAKNITIASISLRWITAIVGDISRKPHPQKNLMSPRLIHQENKAFPSTDTGQFALLIWDIQSISVFFSHHFRWVVHWSPWVYLGFVLTHFSAVSDPVLNTVASDHLPAGHYVTWLVSVTYSLVCFASWSSLGLLQVANPYNSSKALCFQQTSLFCVFCRLTLHHITDEVSSAQGDSGIQDAKQDVYGKFWS